MSAKFVVASFVCLGALALSGCGDSDSVAAPVEPSFVPGEVAIIPRPQVVWVDEHGSRFAIAPRTPVLAEAGNAAAHDAATLLVELLAQAYPDRPAPAEHAGRATPAGAILFTSQDVDPELGEEGYELTVTAGEIVVRALGPRGLLHAVQSLRQLLPPEIESAEPPPPVDWSLPSVQIVDQPRFRWRGLMLDTSRFFPPFEYVLRLIDLLALHKMSVLHLHLSDDQGWRIESERRPELHILGSQFDPELAPGERGGYYTRAELHALVAYAGQRGIEIVPEIDVPGHSLAILRAYPELACTTSPDMVRQRDEFRLVPWFGGSLIHEEVLCACDEPVYLWLADVLDELIDIFPGPWIHLGGDETPPTEWETSYLCAGLVAAEEIDATAEVQAYFSQRAEELVRARGKRMIGWTEVLTEERAAGDRFALSESFVTMHWRGLVGGDPAGLYDRDVVQTPIFTLYLDWYSATSLDEVYAYDPVPAGLTADQAAHVLGAQGSMWTGFPQNRDLAQIDIHLFPKLLAIAELTWSMPDRRDFADFESRRAVHERRLDLLGVTRGPCADCPF